MMPRCGLAEPSHQFAFKQRALRSFGAPREFFVPRQGCVAYVHPSEGQAGGRGHLLTGFTGEHFAPNVRDAVVCAARRYRAAA